MLPGRDGAPSGRERARPRAVARCLQSYTKKPKCKNRPYGRSCILAAGQGFEPRLLGPEPSVLPLDDPAIAASLTYLKTTAERNCKNEKGHPVAAGWPFLFYLPGYCTRRS